MAGLRRDYGGIPLEQRQADYDVAEKHAMTVASRWVEAKAAGKVTRRIETEMDDAQQELRRARRRLERAQRREAR